jgi:hypothetical protein
MQIADSNELMRWYEDKVRGFLASNLGEEKVQAFDKDHARLPSW